jgi:hypothetical protein
LLRDATSGGKSRDLTGLNLFNDVVFDQHSLRVRDLSRSSARDSSRRGEGSNTGLKPEVNIRDESRTLNFKTNCSSTSIRPEDAAEYAADDLGSDRTTDAAARGTDDAFRDRFR